MNENANTTTKKTSCKLIHQCVIEHAMPITPHAYGETVLNRSSYIHILAQFATTLLVVWSAKVDPDK